MDTEDFSFPKICDKCAYSIDSPPLWNLSPAGSPNSSYQVVREGHIYKEDKKDCFEANKVSLCHKKSLSCGQNGKKRTGGDDEEYAMDLLWEDFNEGLSSTTGSVSASASTTSSSREVVEFRCAPALRVVKTHGGHLPTRNKPGMVVILKVLKKLFFLKNSQGKLRKIVH